MGIPTFENSRGSSIRYLIRIEGSETSHIMLAPNYENAKEVEVEHEVEAR